MVARIDLVFFGGVPIVLATLSALLGPYAAIMGGAGATAYVLALATMPWWLTGFATHLAGAWAGCKLPVWLVAAIGAVAAGPFVSLYVYLVNSFAGDVWPGLNTLLPATFSANHLKSAALSEGRAIVLWIALVVIFQETLGWPGLRHPPRKPAARSAFSSAAPNGRPKTTRCCAC